MATGAPDSFGVWATVDAVSGPIQLHPQDTNRIPGAWWQIVVFVGSFPSIQHALIPPKPRESSDSDDLPVTDWRRMFAGARSDWKRCDGMIVLEHFKHPSGDVDMNLPLGQARIPRRVLYQWQLINSERVFYIRDSDGNASLQRIDVSIWIEMCKECSRGVKTFGDHFSQIVVWQRFLLRQLCVLFRVRSDTLQIIISDGVNSVGIDGADIGHGGRGKVMCAVISGQSFSERFSGPAIDHSGPEMTSV